MNAKSAAIQLCESFTRALRQIVNSQKLLAVMLDQFQSLDEKQMRSSAREISAILKGTTKGVTSDLERMELMINERTQKVPDGNMLKKFERKS